jgi:hypothetical protein
MEDTNRSVRRRSDLQRLACEHVERGHLRPIVPRCSRRSVDEPGNQTVEIIVTVHQLTDA